MKSFFFSERGIYYERSGTQHAATPTLLFIHGVSGSLSAWDTIAAHFAKTHDVVAVDIRGHGKSRKPSTYESYTLENIASDIERLMDHLGVNVYIPISHSFGTLVALPLIEAKKAEQAIFLSPVYGIGSSFIGSLGVVLSRTFSFFFRSVRFDESPRGHVAYENYRALGDLNMRRLFADMRNTSWHTYFYCLDHISHANSDAWWENLRTRSLIIHGENDTIVPIRNARALLTRLSHAQLVSLPGANHVLPINCPEAVIGAIESFIKNGNS